MAGLDDLFAQIPVQDIASKLGADQGEVNNAIRTLVPALVGGLAQNVQAEDIDSSDLESAVAEQGTSGLLDGGVSVDQVDENQGDQFVAKIFGGNDSNAVASALAGGGAGSSGLLQKLLPILAPIVLAYIGKQLSPEGRRRTRGRHRHAGPVGRRWRRPRRHPGRHPRRRRWRRCRRREQPAGQHPRQRARWPAGRCARRHPRRPARRQEVAPQNPEAGRRAALHRMAR